MKSSERINQLLGDGIEETLDPELKRSFEFDDNEVPKEIMKPENVRLDKDHFRVSGDGVFYTIQGEGKTMGMPCVFLRLHVCNLRCVWCDAWYTWNPKTPEFWTEARQWTIDQTAENIRASWGTLARIKKRLIVTGGEPLLQKDQIDSLMQRLGADWILEIETNGTIMPTEWQLANAQFNCSPKLRNSQNIDQVRRKKDVIQALVKVNTLFKFVVMHDSDLDEIEKEWVEEYGIPVDQVCLMPQGVTAEEVSINAQRVVEYAKVKGYRLLGRLQNEIWGAKRRV
jgi:organic radical activating enzyme